MRTYTYTANDNITSTHKKEKEEGRRSNKRLYMFVRSAVS
jgi:hypothetical protein